MYSVLPGFWSVAVGSVLTWMTMGSPPPTAALRGAGFVIKMSCRAQARATGWDGLQTSVSAPWVLQGGFLTPRHLVHHRDMKSQKDFEPPGKGIFGGSRGPTRCFWDKTAFGDPCEIVLENPAGWDGGAGQPWEIFLGLGQLSDGTNADAFYFLEKNSFILFWAYLHAKYLEIHFKHGEQQRKRVGAVGVSTSLW